MESRVRDARCANVPCERLGELGSIAGWRDVVSVKVVFKLRKKAKETTDIPARKTVPPAASTHHDYCRQ